MTCPKCGGNLVGNPKLGMLVCPQSYCGWARADDFSQADVDLEHEERDPSEGPGGQRREMPGEFSEQSGVNS